METQPCAVKGKGVRIAMQLFDKMRQQKLMSATLMLFTLSVGILIGTLINTQVNAAKEAAVAPDATPLTIPKPSAIGNEFSALAKKLEASVVNITVDIDDSGGQSSGLQVVPQDPQGGGGDDPQIPDFFRRFFGPDGGGDQPAPQDMPKRQASGTGFIVDKNGYIVTNNHVVENASKIRVKLHGDANDYRGRVIGTDYETDLAVLKIEAGKPLPPVTIGNSDAVQVGDWAVAIGSPFGLEATVTAGIVSATQRDSSELGARQLQRFIQTDAAINPGNSGGPLLNIRGEVIGVNTMIATSRGGSEGVGFALPSNMIVRVYNAIIRDGRVTRGSVGVSLSRNDKPEIVLKALGFDHGAIVEAVSKGGPADSGGVKPMDIIVGVNGQPVKDGDDLVSRVSDIPVGTQSTLNIDRDGKKLDLKVTIRDRQELYKDRPDIVGESAPSESVTSKAEAPSGAVQFGFGPRSLTEQERDAVESHHGVMVVKVEADSFAEEVGLQEHDIIDSINRHPVNSREDIVKIVQTLKPGDPVAFHVIRGVMPPTVQTRGTRNSSRQQPAAPESRFLAGYLPR
jgi:serine protease Do